MRRTRPKSWKSLFTTSLFATSPFSSRRGRAKDRAIARGQFEPLEDRRALATLPAGFVETTVASGFASPTAMEFSPTGELWVIEQSGGVNIVGLGNVGSVAVYPPSFTERGLLGITFDSNYDGTGPNADYVYLYYTEQAGPAGDPPNNRLSRFVVNDAGTINAALGSELILRDLPPEDEDGSTNHNGGAIHFGPDGKLYVAVGDHNYDGVTQANHVSQILTTPFGKILRLNADGTNPDDNPFYTGSASDWEGSIWALGLRNPYTFAFDPDSGAMLINDVGEGTWEEINLGEEAANYGWAGSPAPVWEGFENPPPTWDNYRDPVMAYDHSSADGAPAAVAITGGVFYPSNGPFGSDYAGMYFFADYGANFIRIFDPDNPGQSVNPSATEGDEDTSIGFATGANGAVDLKVDAEGNLYYLARAGGGVIRRIEFTGDFGPTQVEERQLFYNDSGYDDGQLEANAADDGAIATDKTAYTAGDGVAGSGSVSSHAGGINGIMVDVSGNHGPITADDFTFRVSDTGLGVNNAPATWADAPAPIEVLVRGGAGVGDSDRVEIIWADGTITNAWLQVTVEGDDAAGGFNENTGLADSEVFYFGNLIGDTFSDGIEGYFLTDAIDEIEARHNQGLALSTANAYDFNHDGVVDASDQIGVRNNQGILTAIDISGSPPSAPSIAAGDGLQGVASALTIPDTTGSQPIAAAVVDRTTRPNGDQRSLPTRTSPPDEENRRAEAILTLSNESEAHSWLDDEWLDSLLVELAGE